MTLPEILALRPGDGADSTALGAALAEATAKRAELMRQVHLAETLRADALLSADDQVLLDAQREAAQARLAAERMDALLPKLRADLSAARGRETVAELKAEAARVKVLMVELERWQRHDYPQAAILIGAGLKAEHDALLAYGLALVRSDAEFARQEVRDAAPDGVPVPFATGDLRPSHLFPNWEMPRSE